MIGDDLYQLSPRDLQVTWLTSVRFADQVISASTEVLVWFTAPNDRFIYLENAALSSLAGALQITQVFDLQILANNGMVTTIAGWDSNTMINHGASATSLGSQAATVSCPLGIWLFPGEAFRSRTVFDAGVNPNASTMYLVGRSIPRGNVVP